MRALTVLAPGPYVAIVTAIGWSPTAATAIVTLVSTNMPRP